MTTTTPGADRDVFPVDTYTDAVPYLRRPFTAEAVKFKVQATWPKGNPNQGLVVCYIDARLVIERFNLVCPGLWTDERYERTPRGLECSLKVADIVHRDVGEGDTDKALYSDAFKRAAVKFGIGVSLYATPKMFVAVADGRAVQKTNSRDGKTLQLTPAGETFVRNVYSSWLDGHGIKAYGEPLDHGDVMDSQGDTELGELPAEVPADAAAVSAPAQTAARADESGSTLSQEALDALIAAKNDAHLPSTAESTEWLRQQLRAIGAQDVPESGNITLKVLRKLTPDHAEQLRVVLNSVGEARAARRAASTYTEQPPDGDPLPDAGQQSLAGVSS